MKKEFYCVKPTNWHWIILITIILSLTSTVQALGQTGGEATTNE